MTRRQIATEREAADVAPHQPYARLQLRAADALARALQHRRRSIDPDERHAGAAEREGDAPGAAPSSSTGPPACSARLRQNGTSRRPSVRAFSQS